MPIRATEGTAPAVFLACVENSILPVSDRTSKEWLFSLDLAVRA